MFQIINRHISALEALAQAKAAGYDVPITTLNNTCRNEHIPNVRKFVHGF